MLADFIDICEHEGYVKPTVYQGLYNLIDRRPEVPGLDVVVRTHGMQFRTRFADSNIMSTDARRHDKDKCHEAIRSLDRMLEPHAIPKTEVALRWFAFHSKLEPRDGIIFGASKLSQVKQNVAATRRGLLSEDLAAALDGIWDTVK
ncbi:hypothetical protein J3459_014795 [Metarhizium acridum]|uniref:uncharacterized protein n=1 Tax=Metarhizium acridum TaxID=92637 RepID=UPI001C6A9244|nr:hypothetical protein J3458_014389 [Metarhizium acridum]KAG8414410.1 hypothetical protein J3459_014795 [Metarhizium acridum]